jgi:hypothetical protein
MTPVRPFNSFASSSVLVLAALVGCNLHSGSGIDPDEIVEGGASDNGGDGGSINSGSGSGGSGGGSGSTSSGGESSSGTSSGASSGTGNSSGGSGGSSGSSSGGDGADAGPLPGQDSGTTVNPGQCPANPSTCIDCCGTVSPVGYQEFLAAVGPCLCGDGGPGFACASQCENEVCAGAGYMSQNDACETCVNNNALRGAQCFSEAKGSCSGNPDCMSFLSCALGCPSGSQ